MSASHLVLLTDTHAGCGLALCPPQFQKMTGEIRGATEFQLKLWEFYGECCQWVADKLKGENFIFVHGGDMVDGNRGKNSLAWSVNMSDQVNCAKQVNERIFDYVNHDQLEKSYFISGTEYHTGLGHDYDNMVVDRMADFFKVVRTQKQWLLWPELTLKMPNEANFYYTHHTSVQEPLFDTTLLQKAWNTRVTECVRANRLDLIPALVGGGHNHRLAVAGHDHVLSKYCGFKAPGWQGKTHHVYKVASGKHSLPVFGIMIIYVNGDGMLDLDCKRTKVAQEELEVA